MNNLFKCDDCKAYDYSDMLDANAYGHFHCLNCEGMMRDLGHPFSRTDIKEIIALGINNGTTPLLDDVTISEYMGCSDDWILTIPLSNELLFTIRNDGWISYENHFHCKFRIENCLEIYKILIDKLA
jgi:hypothetical protein